MSNAIQYLRDNKEKLTLVGYFALILALAWPMSGMFADAWQATLTGRGIPNAIIRFLRFAVFGPVLSSSHQTVTAAGLGLFLGLLVLMTIDPKKRWQAALLWIGTVIALVGLQSFGLLLPQLNVAEQGPALVGGVVVGFLFGGGRQVIDLFEGETVEFRRASRALFFVMAGLVVVCFVEVHLQYPGIYIDADTPFQPQIVNNGFGINTADLPLHLGASVVFIATAKRFVEYDADREFFILGPRASGKSLFLIGAYLEALERVRSSDKNIPLEPSQDLMSILEALDRKETDWIVEATPPGQVNELSFQYVHGSVFPKNIRLSALDYAGEYLSRLPDALTGAKEWEELDNTERRLVEGIEDSDTLVLTIDMSRYARDEPLDISEYFSILQAVDGKDILLVATKADVLLDEFESERGLEAHLDYEEFTEFVNRRLRQNENIEALVAETNQDIHPVYYQTKVDDDGNRVPMRDDTGTVMTVGFDELLDKLGRL
ncbi:hypothetical protein GRX03_07405 [Halovenus sp. WSH3]|uniref:Uncharacterized protein n=1 Tax=Halovenus carboxidivorans TaxID=2692199 RepID=A0A6B0SZW4_9EURY|nr:hypothetical protein [Halovenus carboxidivorans]MXR51428.1 hypothetical protein [Halovenus carboxidivorans]